MFCRWHLPLHCDLLHSIWPMCGLLGTGDKPNWDEFLAKEMPGSCGILLDHGGFDADPC